MLQTLPKFKTLAMFSFYKKKKKRPQNFGGVSFSYR